MEEVGERERWMGEKGGERGGRHMVQCMSDAECR